MFLLNRDLYISACGTRFSIQNTQSCYTLGEVLFLKAITNQNLNPIINNHIDKTNRLFVVKSKTHIITYQLKIDPSSISVPRSKSLEWLIGSTNSAIDDKEVLNSLISRNKEITEFSTKSRLTTTALVNKISNRQLLSLQSAIESDCLYFEKNSYGWAIVLPMNKENTSTSRSLILTENDMNCLVEKNFIKKVSQYLYKIVKKPNFMRSSLCDELYVQQN